MRKLNLLRSEQRKTDWHYSTIVKAMERPERVSLEKYCGTVRDQGESGLCHSFAGAALKNIQENKEKGYRHNLSPLFLAKRVKEVDSFPGEEGSDLISVCKALSDTGTVREELYPFSAYRAGSLAFPIHDGSGYAYKIKNYARLTEVEDICQALAAGKPVLLGIVCTKEIYDVSAPEPFIPLLNIIMPIGGHAVCVVGYDDTLEHDGHRGFLRIQNSWGTEWGDGGFAWLPYDYLNYRTKDTGIRFLFMDAFCTVDLANDNLKETVVEMTIGERDVYVNGEAQAWDQAPVIDGASWRTLVPLRNVAELLGYAVLWDEKEKKITLVREG